MTKDQLIAEFQALPQKEQWQVAEVIFSRRAAWYLDKTIEAGTEISSAQKAAKMQSFSERWSGKFTLPQPDTGDSRLNYLLERFGTT